MRQHLPLRLAAVRTSCRPVRAHLPNTFFILSIASRVTEIGPRTSTQNMPNRRNMRTTAPPATEIVSTTSEEASQDEEGGTSLIDPKEYACLPASLTKHVPVLDHPLPGRPSEVSLKLKQISSMSPSDRSEASGASKGTGTTGTTLWLGAQVMACYLADAVGRGDTAVGGETQGDKGQAGGLRLGRRKTVLELGGGIGYLSLVLASLGYDVVTTDIKPSVETVLRPNIESNLSSHASLPPILVKELDWSTFGDGTKWISELVQEFPRLESVQRSGFDMIVTTDTIYSSPLTSPLLSTIRTVSSLSASPPAIFLAIEARDPTLNARAIEQANEMGFTTKKISGARVRKSVEKGGRWGWGKALRGEWEGVEVWKWTSPQTAAGITGNQFLHLARGSGADMPTDLRGLCVGGTSGIGRAIALRLANSLPSSRITIAGRSASNGRKVSEDAAHANVDFVPVDCASFADVKRFCKEIAAGLRGEQLDLLVLSPGILTMQGYTPTVDGVDVKMSLHYYARMLIIRELLASESLSPNAAVLSVLDGRSSNPHAKNIKWDDMDLSRPGSYGIAVAAAHCTSFTDVQLSTFAMANPGMTFVHAYPGIVDTPLLEGVMPKATSWLFKPLVGMISMSAELSAERILKGVRLAMQARAGTAEDGSKGDRLVSLAIDKILDKREIGDALREKVEKHTWELIDSKDGQ